MLEPRLIEHHLSKIQKEVGEKSTLANTYFRLVKPIEENLKQYSNLEKQIRFPLHFSVISSFFKISYEILKSVIVAVIKKRESASFQVPMGFENQRIFVSHYTHAQVPSKPDVFFDQLPSAKDLIFYHNNTWLNRTKIVTRLNPYDTRPNFLVTTKSLGLKNIVSLQFKNLYTSVRMLKYALMSRRFTAIERRILICAATNQVSRQTLANQINLNRLDSVLTLNRPSILFITLEGHAYEALYIELIHNKFPGIRLMAFQHAPIVPDQFGLIRNLLKLNSNDVILASGEITRDFFVSLNLKAGVRLIGSPKWRLANPKCKSEFPITVLGAAEGTYESIENFSRLFEGLDSLELNLKLILRVHPAVSSKEASKILSRVKFGENLVLSTRPLNQDLEESHFCIYRSSAVAIEGLRFGVTPLYFNPNGDQGLNPLYFAKFEMPVFRNLKDFKEYFKTLSELGDVVANNRNQELFKIGSAYYTKLDPSALNGF